LCVFRRFRQRKPSAMALFLMLAASSRVCPDPLCHEELEAPQNRNRRF
jgi:hypothetical protein